MEHSEKKQKRKKRWRIVIIVVVVLVIIRIALPYAIVHMANKKLGQLKAYRGHVDDVDLAIYRGAYKVHDVYLHRLDTVTGEETKFYDVKLIDLSVEWRALFHGRIVGKVLLDEPELRFTKDKAEPSQVKKDTVDFRYIIDHFMPLDINRLEIKNGTVRYVDHGSKPKVDIQLSNLHVTGENLSNVNDSSKVLPSNIRASAEVYGGVLDLTLKLDPLAKKPTFDLNAELKDTQLSRLNDFFKAYGKFDVNKGTFGLYTEVASKQGTFVGYVKPLIKDLDVKGPEDAHDNFLQKFWEGVVGTVGVILRNQPHDQIASKVPLEGTFNKANANLWYAITEVLSNAFIQALRPSIDDQININSVSKVPDKEKTGFFKKLFGKNKDKAKEETKKDKK